MTISSTKRICCRAAGLILALVVFNLIPEDFANAIWFLLGAATVFRISDAVLDHFIEE